MTNKTLKATIYVILAIAMFIVVGLLETGRIEQLGM